MEAAFGVPLAGGAVPVGFVPKMFGAAVEEEGLVPVSKSELPKGLLLLDGVAVSKSEEEPLVAPDELLPEPKEELAPASDEPEDEELPPLVSCARSQ